MNLAGALILTTTDKSKLFVLFCLWPLCDLIVYNNTFCKEELNTAKSSGII